MFKVKTITKRFNTLQKADGYQFRLCNKYEFVRLFKSPRFGEAGTYVWKVANKEVNHGNS